MGLGKKKISSVKIYNNLIYILERAVTEPEGGRREDAAGKERREK